MKKMDTSESLNNLTKYHLELLERIRQLRNDLLNEDLLFQNNMQIKSTTISKIEPVDIIEDYDPDTDKEMVKQIQQKIVEIETWYISMDTTKSFVLDSRVNDIVKKHGFNYGHIINMKDENQLLIQLEDKEKENKK
jgi:hypothetical protein